MNSAVSDLINTLQREKAGSSELFKSLQAFASTSPADWKQSAVGDLDVAHRGALPDERRLSLSGSGSLLVLVGEIERPALRVMNQGQNNRLVIVGGSKKIQASFRFTGSNNIVVVGPETTMNSATFVVDGNNLRLVLGVDCMLSHDITFWCGDRHAIVDVATGSVLNAPRSIVVGDHVWIGHNATVLKGVAVRSGSIIAASAVVAGVLEDSGIYAGNPARKVRDGVTWTRDPRPGPDDIQEALGWLSRQ